jgi:flavin-dependent dehydrogenase
VKHVDVVVIGGSLAGSACVRELVRRGIDAIAYERDRFPREKVCGGFLSPGALQLLHELGLADRVRAAGASPVQASRVRLRNKEVFVELPKQGYGISRRTLDALVADHPAVRHGNVSSVDRQSRAFRVRVGSDEISARVVIDAAGKLSRFTPGDTSPQFGVQFYEDTPRAGILDFWFFAEGYGGAVTVEGGRSNACFLINKDAVRSLSRCLPTAECIRDPLVTGPVSYRRFPTDYIAIGDAAGMVDPFCGEGMRHALDTGMHAARVVADGLAAGSDYAQLRFRYEQETAARWSAKRRLGSAIRVMLQHPRLLSAGFRFRPDFWFRKLWG